MFVQHPFDLPRLAAHRNRSAKVLNQQRMLIGVHFDVARNLVHQCPAVELANNLVADNAAVARVRSNLNRSHRYTLQSSQSFDQV